MLFLHKVIRGARIAWAFAISLTELLLRRPASRRARAEWLTRFCRRVLAAANVSWSVAGPIPQQGAVISNHLTYLDILVHSALRPCVFVSAIEIRRMPLIGWISMMAGTVFVTRGAGGSAAKAAGGMAEGFRDGLPVVFFPEGGTGVGDVPLLPLHTGLLATAIEEGASVTAGFLSYELSPADVAAGRSAREDVHWGDQSLPAHAWNLLGLGALQARISFSSRPIAFSPAALADRKIAAEEARHTLLELHEAGDRDKHRYHESNL
jgi:1-acyl-sn-glycerol-3-phosphate acyltransferase